MVGLENGINDLSRLCFYLGLSSVGDFRLGLPWRAVGPPFSSSCHATSHRQEGFLDSPDKPKYNSIPDFKSTPHRSQSL